MKITLGSKYNEQYFYILCSKGKKNQSKRKYYEPFSICTILKKHSKGYLKEKQQASSKKAKTKINNIN